MNLCFTAAAINHIKQSLLVRDSFLRHNSGWRFVIIVADIISDRKIIEEIIEYRKKGAEFVFLTELLSVCQDFPFGEAVASYESHELESYLKSVGFKYFFKLGCDKVLCVEPYMKFYNSVSDAWGMLEKYDAVLTPQMTEPYPENGSMRKNQRIFMSGLTNTGFIAVKNTPDGNMLIDFWMKYAKDKGGVWKDFKIHDQPWAVWFPYLSDNVLILKNKGYNAAVWNLHERIVSIRNGKWLADDSPLVCFNFTGLDRYDEAMFKYKERYGLSGISDDLMKLFSDYVKDLESRALCASANTPFFSSYLPNTDFRIDSCFFRRLLSIYVNKGYSHISADMDSELFMAQSIADSPIHVKPGFCFDVIGSFSSDNEAKDFLLRFLSLGVFFSIIDTAGSDCVKIPYLKHFYADKTNNPGAVFFISDLSASYLIGRSDFFDGKTMKIAVLSDYCDCSEDNLRDMLVKFDRVVALSDKSFKKASEILGDYASCLHAVPLHGNAPDYEFFDSFYGIFAGLEIGSPPYDGKSIFSDEDLAASSRAFKKLEVSIKTTDASYAALSGSYKALKEEYEKLESSYSELDDYYKKLENFISYRLGRLLTAPASFILKIFGKK